MKKLITTIFAIGLLLPLIAEAGVSPEGKIRKKSYYRRNKPRIVPMGF